MSQITINIKSSSDSKLAVTILTSSTVRDLKAEIANKLENTPVESQRLIYSGKVLKDDDILETYKMGEGHTVHLVRSQARSSATTSSNAGPSNNTQATPTSPNSPPQGSTPNNPFAMPGLNPFAGLGGMGMGGMPDPAMLSSIMSNPLIQTQMQQMLSNPAMLETVFANNPMLASMDTPEMRTMMQQMFSNPQLMQSMFGLLGGRGGGMGGGMGGVPSGAAPTNTDGNVASNPFVNLTANQRAATGAGTTSAFNPFTMDPSLMAMLGGFGAPGARTANSPVDNRPPEEKYATQLQQLVEMGFYEPERNLRALQMTGGNVNAAIEWLFSNP